MTQTHNHDLVIYTGLDEEFEESREALFPTIEDGQLYRLSDRKTTVRHRFNDAKTAHRAYETDTSRDGRQRKNGRTLLRITSTRKLDPVPVHVKVINRLLDYAAWGTRERMVSLRETNPGTFQVEVEVRHDGRRYKLGGKPDMPVTTLTTASTRDDVDDMLVWLQCVEDAVANGRVNTEIAAAINTRPS